MATYGPFPPPVLPDNAEQQRRQISDYQSSVGANATTGQGFVNDTNTNILSSPAFNLNKEDKTRTQNFGADATGPNGPDNTAPGSQISGTLNTSTDIVPQPNVLDRFASYTYSASVYLMSTKQYTQLLRSKKKTINGYNLLFQSGGAPPNNGGFQGALGTGQQNSTGGDGTNSTTPPGGILGTNDVDAGRNPAFPLDFYIDSITIDNALPGRQTQSPHMVTSLKFTVVEPGNISLLDRLYKAVQDMAQTIGESTQTINYTAAAYLMVIRWYGYDINGNLVAVGAADPNTGLTDPNAVVEKFIPFLIRKINWQVSSKLVTYEFDCAPINQKVAGGTRRGTIPYDVQLTDSNVGKLLGGDLVYASESPPTASAANPGAQTAINKANGAASASAKQRDALANASRRNRANAAANQRVPAAPAQSSQPVNNTSSGYYNPPKANSAASAKQTVKDGLMGAMNAYQQQLVKDGIYTAADTYEIVFVADAKGNQPIRDARITLPADRIVEQNQTPISPGPTQAGGSALNQAALSADFSNRNYSITAGMQLIQAIDLAIRNSTYITDQALTVYSNGVEVPNEKTTVNAQSPMKWFQISMEAQQGVYDTARNDHVYHIKYIISPYELFNFDSKYFPLTKFRGLHKSYPYWFTGQNTAVLDYTANFNSLYNITVTGNHADQSEAAKLRKQYTSSMREIPMYTYMPASNASRQGADVKGNEIPANASEYLYSPGDLGQTKLRIIGDPAWIQQGSLAGGVNTQEFGYSAFLPDGTINFDASQVMFEIAWQRPEDYNLSTGLADPYARPGNEARQPQQSNVYHCVRVVSEFKAGKFEQTLEGALFQFPIPSGKNTAATAGNPNGAQNGAQGRQLPGVDARGRQNAAADPRTLTNRTAAINNNNGAASASARLTDALRSRSRSAAAAAGKSGTPVAPAATTNQSSPQSAPTATATAASLTPLPPARPVVSNGQTFLGSLNTAVASRLPPNVAARTQGAAPSVPQQGQRDF
jgi:hypothetical protein